MTPRAERARAEALGRTAETLAAAYLAAKAYRILARRFRTPKGEIDLVARRGATLVFAEVKLRAKRDDALGAVTRRNRRRIVEAARFWLMRHPQHARLNIRFDVIVMAPWRWPGHIVAAFEPNGEERRS